MAATNNTEFILTARDLASGTISKVGTALSGLANPAAAANAALGSLAGGAALLGLAAVAKSAIDAADNLNDLSQRTGVAIKDLAAYKLAAEQSGSSLEGVAKGIKTLSTNLVENGAALSKIGIDTKDANVAIRQLADVFKDLPDGVEKSALATKLFGKAGQELIPLLNGGSEALDRSAESSATYAKVMADLAPAADKFNDNLSQISLIAKEVGASFASVLVPNLNSAAEAFISAQKAGTGFFRAFAEAALGAASGASAEERIKGLTKELKAAQDVLAVPDQSTATIELYTLRVDELTKKLKALKGLNPDVRIDGNQGQVREIENQIERRNGGSAKSLKELMAALGGEAKKTKVEIDKNLQAFEKLAQTIGEKTQIEREAIAATGALTEGEKIRAKLIYDLAEGQIKLNDTQKKTLAGALDGLIVVEKERQAKEALAKAEKDWLESLEKANTAARDSVAAQVDRAIAAEEELATYGLTKSAIEETIIARLEEQIRMTAGLDSQAELVANLEKEIEARKRVANAMRGIEAKDAAKKSAEDAAKAWEKFSDDIERSLTDALMRSFESGNGFGKTFVETLKNTLKTAALKIVVQAIVDPVTNGLKGLAGGGQGGIIGSLASGSNLLSAGSSIINGGALFGAGQGIVNSGLYMASGMGSQQAAMLAMQDAAFGMEGAAATLEAAGSSALSSLSAAAPWIAGALLVGSLLSKDGGGPKREGFYGSPGYSGADDAMVGSYAQGAERAFAAIASRYGLSGVARATAQISQDPQGTAQTQLNLGLSANGQTLYDRNALKGGIENVGRSEADLKAAMVDALNEAILFAVAKSEGLPAAVAKLFDDFEGNIESLSNERGAALVAALTGGWLEEIINSGDSLDVVAEAALRLADIAPQVLAFRTAVESLPFDNLKDLSLNAAANLVQVAGGIEKLAPAINSYYEEFYTAEEKRALALDAANKVVAESFAAIETSVPATRAEFRDLIESLDLTTESGRKTYATLLKAAPAFDAVADAADQSLRDLAQEWTGFDAAGLGRLILDSAFNREIGESAAAEFAKALEESVRNALISSVVGNIATSIYEAIVLPMVAGAAVSKETIAEVTETAQAAINSLGAVLDTLDLSAIIGAVPDLSQLVAPKPATSSGSTGSTSSGLDAIEDAQRAIADERANLERQLLQLQGDTVELRRREREALDESNRAIYDQIKALEDQKDAERAAAEAAEKAARESAEAAAKRLADSRSQLDTLSQIAGLTGDNTLAAAVKASQRELKLVELASQGASQEMVDLVKWLFAAEDAADAARKSLEAANKSLDGMKRIADELKQVADFRDGIGASQQGIRSQMAGFDAVAFQAGQQAAAQAALDGLGDDATTAQRIAAGKKLQDAILGNYDAQRAAIEKNRNAAEAAARTVFEAEEAARRQAIESANQLNAAYRNVGEYAKSLLLSAQSPLSGRSRLAAAGSDFTSLAARARTGDLDALGRLQGSSSAYLDEARTMAVSSADYGRVFGRVVGELTQIGGLAGKDMEYTTRQFYFDSAAYDEQMTALQTSTLAELESLAELTDDWTTALQEQMTEDALVFAEIGLSTEQTATLLQGLGPGFESVVTAVNAATAAQADTAAMLATMQAMQAEIAALRQSQAVATAQARRTADAVNGNPEAPMLVETT